MCIHDAPGARCARCLATSRSARSWNGWSDLVDTQNPTDYAQVIDELVNGSVTRTYAYGLQRISQNQLISSAWTPSLYGYDAHGSVRYLTNAASTGTDNYEYDAFGT